MFFSIVGFLFTVFSHAALVSSLAVLFRSRFRQEDLSAILPFSTIPLIPLGLCLLYACGAEAFIAYYGGNKFEADAFSLRFSGPYWFYFALSLIAVISTQIFWIRRFRKSAFAALIVGLLNLFR